MANDSDTSFESLYFKIVQICVWFILLILILYRCVNFDKDVTHWIWVINYIGMWLAAFNLLLGECFRLYKKGDKKYKTFVGFTIVIVIILTLLGFLCGKLQTSQHVDTINDVVTLLALYFSLSQNVWEDILGRVAEKLR